MKKVKLFPIFMSSVLATAALAGCGSATKSDPAPAPARGQEIHLAVIIGSHGNAPLPNFGLIEDQVYNACYTYGSVTLVCDDGDPFTIVIDIPPEDDNLSTSKYKQIANEQTKQILSAASQMQAKTEEVNTLKAIQLGARSLESMETESDDVKLIRQMIVLDSCLSTTGALSFSEHNLSNIDTADIVSQLQEIDEIPALDDVSVTVYTCGDTAGKKQKALPEASRKVLKNVWESILEAGNADVNIKDDLPLSSIFDEEALPSVTPVTVVQDIVDIHDVEEVADAFAEGGVISFDEKSIAFEMGTANLANKDAAKDVLNYVVEYMNTHPDLKILVCGTTACWGGEEYCKALSNDRASVICQLLINDFGIDKSRVQATGVGYSFDDFYTYDHTPDGELDEAIAPSNRSVKLINLDSDTASRILNMK